MKMGTAPMPTTQEHQDKQSMTELARSDLEQSPNNPQHADWIVTLAFYKSLHAVDSYFAKLGIHPKGHGQREQFVRNHLESIHERYRALYEASIIARYQAYTYDPQEATRLVHHSLVIEAHINTLL
jgi:hypothetical protein